MDKTDQHALADRFFALLSDAHLSVGFAEGSGLGALCLTAVLIAVVTRPGFSLGKVLDMAIDLRKRRRPESVTPVDPPRA